MNYEELKTSIDSRIFENTSQLITGENLNTTLKEVVNTLGEGYQFGGLVSPDSEYEGGDAKIAFIANTAGEYTDFGGFSLRGGEIALFLWDGSWREQRIYVPENTDIYGIRHYYNNASPDLTRIGKIELHASLPVQSLMRRCVVNDDGEVVYYLDANNSTLKEDGTAAVLDGTDGQVMVEVPEHYRRVNLNTEDVYMDVEISLYDFLGAKRVPRYLVSAFEAALDRTDNVLCSIVNTDARYRGGSNESGWDNTYRSLLGMPVTLKTPATIRQNAKARGMKWAINDWTLHCDIFWLFAIEYATLNSQKAIDNTLDIHGWRKGGLGEGVTNLNFNMWGTYNDRNPIIPCGYTLSLGNNTGEVEFTFNTEQREHYGSDFTTFVPSYRGIENPFGHLAKATDGILWASSSQGGGTWVSRDRSRYSHNTLNLSYEKVSERLPQFTYAKKIVPSESSLPQAIRNYGDVIYREGGGSSTTYFCDYHNGIANSCATIGRCGYDGDKSGLASVDDTTNSGTLGKFEGTRLTYCDETVL